MRNFLKTTTLIIVVGLVTLINGCAKDGKDGTPGPTGPIGLTGATGTNGNANVKNINVVVVTSDWWLNSGTYRYDKFLPEIDQNIVDNGMVLAYMESSPYSETWVALPFSIKDVEINYSYWEYYVSLIVSLGSGATPNNPGIVRFKVLVVQGTARLSNPNIDFNDYYQVKAAFNLKD